MNNKFTLGISLAVATHLLAVLAQGSVPKVLVTTGDPMPDGNGTFSAFDLPAMNNAGGVAFHASASGATNNSSTGVFLGQAEASIEQVVREGQLSPDNVSRFDDVWGANWGDLALNQSGGIAFVSKLSNTPNGVSDDHAIFIANGGGNSMTQLAREGQFNGTGNWPQFPALLDPNFNNRHQFSLLATVSGPGLNSTNNQGLFRINTTNLAVTEIVRTGDLIPTATGYFQELFNANLNEAGQLAFVANLTGVPLNTHRGIYRGDEQQTVEIARQGPSGTFTNGYFDEVTLYSEIPLNDAGVVAFRAKYYVGPDKVTGILCGDGILTTEIARSGHDIPGISNKIYSIPGTLDLNNQGQAAFLCQLTGFPAGDSPRALLRGDGTTLNLISYVGQPIPGSTNTVSDFTDVKLSLNERGDVATIAFLDNGVRALLVVSDELGILEIARVGQPFLGSTITALDFNGSTPGNIVSRERSGLNDRGDLAFKFTLADTRQGIAVWQRPALALAAELLSGGHIKLNFIAYPGWTNYLQACDLSFNFSDISSPIVATGEAAVLTNHVDWNAFTNGPTRFYRLRATQ